MDTLYDLYEREFSQTWFQFILDNPDKNWDWNELSANPNITMDIVNDNPHIKWNHKQISKGIHITRNTIRDNPSVKWDYYMLSINPTLTWDIVCQHPNKKWCYKWLSAHPNIHWEIVRQHPEKPWNYMYLSMNQNITWNIVQQHPKMPWNYMYLSMNQNITWNIAQKHPELKRHYTSLRVNPNVRRDFIDMNMYTYMDDDILSYETLVEMLDNPDKCMCDLYYTDSTVKYVDLLYLSSQPNISWDIVQNNPDRGLSSHDHWDYVELSTNPMTAWKQRFILAKLQDHFRTSTLKEELMQKMFHPKNLDKFEDWGFGLYDDE